MHNTYHLKLNHDQTKAATLAMMPGDPFRTPRIADEIVKRYGGTKRELAWHREFRTFLCSFDDKNLLVTSTGIGGPSTAIAIDELATMGVDTIIRVGTCGGIQKAIKPGDLVITTGSVRLDGASTHYAPIEYPAVAHPAVIHALTAGASDAGLTRHVGITASSDTFYPGQERYDSFTRYVIRRFQDSLAEWRKLNVLNYEMESATVLTLGNVMGLRAGCVTGVVVNREAEDHVCNHDLELGEANAVKAAVFSIKYLV